MKIRIKASSRLHLGFMDLNGSLGRLYGSVGVSLSNPGTDITVKHHSHISVRCTDKKTKKRIIDCVKTFSEHYKIEPNVMVMVHDSIPEHKGLGSGTQLALVVSTALAHLFGIRANTYDLSMLMGRGMRSSIGIWSFEHGGLIIDSGIKKKEDRTISEPPKALITYDFPEEWKFVIAVPEESQGLSGEQEKEAIRMIDPPKKISEEICRLVMMKLLPSLLEKDIENFGSSLTEIDRNTGLFFRPVQGGIYSEKLSDKIIVHLLASGAYGAGQSSWGPAIYGLTTAAESVSLASSMEDFMVERNIKGNVIISSGRNSGAKIEIQKCEKKDSIYNANRNQIQFSLSDSDMGACNASFRTTARCNE